MRRFVGKGKKKKREIHRLKKSYQKKKKKYHIKGETHMVNRQKLKDEKKNSLVEDLGRKELLQSEKEQTSKGLGSGGELPWSGEGTQ